MRRARTLVMAALLGAAVTVATGCGYNGPTGSYDGQGYASDHIGGTSIFDRVLESDDPGSTVWRDTSIHDSIGSSYGVVPGSTAIGSAGYLSNLELDDATSSSVFDDLSFDDPTLADVSFESSAGDLDGFDSIDAISFDAASEDAAGKYGTTGYTTGDPELDALMLEDPSVEDPYLATDAGIDPEFDPGLAGDYLDY